jgi:hypothetical protein
LLQNRRINSFFYQLFANYATTTSKIFAFINSFITLKNKDFPANLASGTTRAALERNSCTFFMVQGVYIKKCLFLKKRFQDQRHDARKNRTDHPLEHQQVSLNLRKPGIIIRDGLGGGAGFYFTSTRFYKNSRHETSSSEGVYNRLKQD